MWEWRRRRARPLAGAAGWAADPPSWSCAGTGRRSTASRRRRRRTGPGGPRIRWSAAPGSGPDTAGHGSSVRPSRAACHGAGEGHRPARRSAPGAATCPARAGAPAGRARRRGRRSGRTTDGRTRVGGGVAHDGLQALLLVLAELGPWPLLTADLGPGQPQGRGRVGQAPPVIANLGVHRILRFCWVPWLPAEGWVVPKTASSSSLIHPGFPGGSIAWKAGWSHGTQQEQPPLAEAVPA
jgi:hypothetical protein